jgi:parallel beta-helix repeat protein
MMDKIKILLVSIMLLTYFTVVVFPVETVKASGNTFYVGGSGSGNYTSIQSAIDAASSGDIIFVYNGNYSENININKTIDLIGEDKNNTIIESGNDNVVFINESGVNITNFNIRNGMNGIFINSNYCMIKSNIILNNSYCGILLNFSNNTLISDNIIKNNTYCIQSWYSNYCLIDYNIFNNSVNTTWFYESNHNIIRENNIYGEYLGIGLLSNCQGNKIYHNNFFGLFLTATAHDDGLNDWDDGYPSGGNYWSDFDEPIEGAYDNNSDGIVDDSYQIPETWYNPSGDNFDYYPLMSPYNTSDPFADIYVDDDALPNWYDATHVKTIQEGINNASDWNTVYVYNGTYNENIVVNKIINLIGEDRNGSIIDGEDKGDTVRLEKNSTIFDGFTVIHGSYHGIHLISSSTSIINNCISHSNEIGIYLEESNLNVISNCLVYNNSWIGIGIFNYSTNNLIFHNNILSNTINAQDTSNNTWDNGFPSGGNYWDDYTGSDNYQGPNQDIPGGDKIGDIPYNITGGNNQDLYPFMEQNGWLNHPPNIPSSPNPTNNSKNIDINTNLSWIGGDPDCGTIVTYDIYFGTSSDPPLKKSNHFNTSYEPGIMDFNTTYYWKIIAKDNHGESTTGPIWKFTTTDANHPPNTPFNPTPQNGTTSIDIEQDLYWNGSDPDIGDTVTYDVYFGSIQPLQKITSNISTTTYNLETLENNLTYFWYIVAWDNHGASTAGPEWYFTTIKITYNKPPNKPSKPTGVTSGKIGNTHSFTSSTTDPENDYVYYWFDWGDGTNSGWDGPHYSGDNVTLAHSWVKQGTYPIKVKAKDIYDNESVWSNPLVINMPKMKINNPAIQLIYRLLKYFPVLEKLIWLIPNIEKILN